MILLAKVPDPYLLNTLRDAYQKEIDAEIEKLNLSFSEALSILKRKKYVDYIGPVEIKIDFSKNILNTDKYDKAHCCDNNDNIKPASKIISDVLMPATSSWCILT